MTDDRRRGWVGEVGQELRRIGPPVPTRVSAVRAAVTLLVPLVLLAAWGRLDLSLYATFGAFSSVYGGAAVYRGRWRQQRAGALTLTLAVASGSLAAATIGGQWTVVPLAAAWAAIAATLSDRNGWRPPGPVFAVFAVASSASVPLVLADLPAVLGTIVATAAFGLALGVLEERVVRPSEPGPPIPHIAAARARLHALRCLAVVAVAGAAMTASGITHPYWAMVAAVAPLIRPGLHLQIARGLHRVGGTVAGLAVAALLLALDLPEPVVIALLVALLFSTELVVTRHYGFALVLITPLALLAVQLAHPVALGELLASRLIETVVGSMLGVGVAILTRERASPADPSGDDLP